MQICCTAFKSWCVEGFYVLLDDRVSTAVSQKILPLQRLFSGFLFVLIGHFYQNSEIMLKLPCRNLIIKLAKSNSWSPACCWWLQVSVRLEKLDASSPAASPRQHCVKKKKLALNLKKNCTAISYIFNSVSYYAVYWSLAKGFLRS